MDYTTKPTIIWGHSQEDIDWQFKDVKRKISNDGKSEEEQKYARYIANYIFRAFYNSACRWKRIE